MTSSASLRPAPRGAIQWFFTADRPVLVAIALNACVLFLSGFEQLDHLVMLEFADYAFTTYFIVEMALKMRAHGGRGYFASSWNRFDFAAVAVSLPSYLLLFFDIPDLSFLLLLRVARVAKFFRFIRFVPNMPQLVDGVRRAARASAFVLLAFFLYNFVFALVSCHLFRDVAPEHFRDPLVSFYSMFKVFTVEGWNELPDGIAAHAGPTFTFFTRLYFMLIVLSSGIFGLSLINAIFVDEMLRNENDLVERRIDELHAKVDALLARSEGPPPGSGRD